MDEFRNRADLTAPESQSGNCPLGSSQVLACSHPGPTNALRNDIQDQNGTDDPSSPSLVQQTSRKRQRPDVSRRDVVYARKRAIAACRQCRIRKVKCNNARPCCSSCAASKASCTYEDTQDVSAYDPASIVIIDKLNQVLSRLDQIQTPSVGPYSTSPANDAAKTPAEPNPRHCEAVDQDQGSEDQQDQQDQLHIPSSGTNVDSVLQWPIFGNRFPPNYLTNAVYESAVDDESDGNPKTSRTSVRLRSVRSRAIDIDEEDISDLVRRFLYLVHIKNPILDIDTVWSYTRGVVEDGLKWDAASCLVLLACALGSVAMPFLGDAASTTETPTTSVEAQAQDIREGEAYYNLARRRFGLLGVGILPSQCHFLAGVYNMYLMRPLAAWSQFQSATKAYYLYLQCQARRPTETGPDSIQSSQKRSLEQRLYWSCFKSECELRTEIGIPNSSLADIPYSYMHPSPPDMDENEASPEFGSPPQGSLQSSRIGNSSTPVMRRQQEQSWFYYLTEITLRRIANRVLNLLYADDHTKWTEDSIVLMATAAEHVEQQLEEWYAELPPLIRFSDDIPSEELPYHVRCRVLETKSWLYAPFLYYAIHSAPDAPHRDRIKVLVDKAVSYTFLTIRVEPIRHRHHGTWYSCRTVIYCCLYIIGAVRCRTIAIPNGWREEVRLAIGRLRYWAAEGPGIDQAFEVLENYLDDD